MKNNTGSAIRRLIWSLRLAFIPTYYIYYRELKRLEKASREDVLSYQHRRLTKLLEHCVLHVPYYRASFQDYEGDSLIEWFNELQPLSKNEVRQNSIALKSEQIQKGEYNNTSGGSTGEPLKFIQHLQYRTWGRAITDFFDGWCGYHFGHRMIRLWGSERDLFVGNESFKTRVGKFLRNEQWINSFIMSEDDMKLAVNTINEFRPVHIVSYVESINSLALFIEENQLEVHSPLSIMTSAGTLYADMREKIERIFNCKVYNRYGSREVGNVASQFSIGEEMHICEPNYVVEVLDENLKEVKDGEIGELVVTNLSNYSMPLLKYRIDDCAIPMEGFGDGPKWRRLKNVIGRANDFFLNDKGEKVHGTYFAHLLYEISGIQKFQFLQTGINTIELKLVLMKKKELSMEDQQKIVDGVRHVMSRKCKVDFIYLETIAPLKSGKYQYIVSQL